MKLDGKSDAPRGEQVAPSRGRGLKLPSRHTGSIRPLVAPSRGRGLKPPAEKSKVMLSGRPFTGAWIETPAVRAFLNWSIVAPSRGRGLKPGYFTASEAAKYVAPSRGRGLKRPIQKGTAGRPGRPFTGAWIETACPWWRGSQSSGRPFTGAWIETGRDWRKINKTWVAPSRGRGLKLSAPGRFRRICESPLHGGVD